MVNYIPFLKLKVNEIGALSILADDIQEEIMPFFDLPKQQDGATPEAFIKMSTKAAKSVTKNLGKFKSFFVDNFDIDDTIVVNGKNNYAFVIECFSDLDFVPVVGLDRTMERNKLVFEYKDSGVIKSDTVAIRLLADDFLSFELVKYEIADLIGQGSGLFNHWVLVLDNRVCTNISVLNRASQIVQFVSKSTATFEFKSVIITGSSVPASIKELLDVESEGTYERKELEIYREASKGLGQINLYMGDYTIVSPLYSEFTIPPEAMRNVMTPKIFYSYDNLHYVARGGALKTHARGDQQYNDIARYLISKPFYRNPGYSFGDHFLHEKASYKGNAVTPSSILKPTINAHMTYMVRDFSI